MKVATILLAMGLVVTGAALSSPSRAATLGKGTLEIEGAVDFDHTSYKFDSNDLGSTTSIAGSAGAGYSLSPLLQVGGGLLLSHYSVDAPGEGTVSYGSYGVTGDVTFNFSTPNNLVPFVRLGVGLENFTGAGSENAKTAIFVPMVRAGVRVLVGESGSVNLSVAYRHEINSGGSKDLKAEDLSFAVGLSLFPIRGK